MGDSFWQFETVYHKNGLPQFPLSLFKIITAITERGNTDTLGDCPSLPSYLRGWRVLKKSAQGSGPERRFS
jgi:hypothetical protein